MPVEFVALNRVGWTAYASDSFNSSYLPVNFIDGNVRSAWVQSDGVGFPHSIWVDMGASFTFNAISFQRRQDGPQDSPGQVAIYHSDDGMFWAGPSVVPTWTNTGTAIIQPIPSITARWVKVTMIDAAAGARGQVSCAELLVGQSVDTAGSSGLTLQCTCSKNPNVSGCDLIALTFHASLDFASQGGMGIHAIAELVGGPVEVGIGLTATPTTVDVSLDVAGFKAAWSNLAVHFGGVESLFQPISAGSYALATGSWYILQTYRCIDDSSGTPVATIKKIYSVTTDGSENICIEDGITKQITTAASGGTAVLFTSSPLGTCDNGGGGDVFVGGFIPPPKDDNNLIDESTSSGQVCLCVSGGVAPYKYSIASGMLPCGQTLNEDTGCIEGTADGSCPGTDSVTVQVIDSQNNIATVECGFLRPCAGAGGGDFGNVFN